MESTYGIPLLAQSRMRSPLGLGCRLRKSTLLHPFHTLSVSWCFVSVIAVWNVFVLHDQWAKRQSCWLLFEFLSAQSIKYEYRVSYTSRLPFSHYSLVAVLVLTFITPLCTELGSAFQYADCDTYIHKSISLCPWTFIFPVRCFLNLYPE